MITAECVSVWGCDADVVANARVSFDVVYSADDEVQLSRRDQGLIKYLKRGIPRHEFDHFIHGLSGSAPEDIEVLLREFKNRAEHWTPFANGIGAKFLITAPIPIMRQVFKTKVGTVESEVSRRYVSNLPEYHIPEFHKAAPNVKQGSSDDLLNNPEIDLLYRKHLESSNTLYAHMIESGVAPEEARYVLPQAMLTQAVVSNSLYGWSRFYNQRTDCHAQRDVRTVAECVGVYLESYFPVSWKVLTT